MHRRHFLTLLAGTTALTACVSNTTLDAIASDITDIAQGFLGVTPIIAAIPGLASSALASISDAVGNLQQIAEKVRQAVSTIAAQPLVQQVETNLNAIIAVLANVPALPPVIQVVLQAATILLPLIEAAVNLVIPPRLAARAAATHMSPDQARAVLRSLAPQH
jgi:hypothetical protein